MTEDEEAGMQRGAVRVIMMVVAGIIGGYFGYWIGHAAGWSSDADWPWHIGGGTGAILLSIGLALIGVLVVWLLLALWRRSRGE